MNSATGGNIIFRFKGDTSDLDRTTKKATTGFKGLTKSIAVGNLVAQGISKAFSVISQNMDSAITRFDTLKNFSNVMKNLGVDTNDAEKAINKMSEKLMGLPTTLDQGAMAVQRFTSKNGDVKKSADMFLAVNNAILAGGAGTELQANALEQLTQAYAKGKMDMQEWRTLQMAMPAQLKQVASSMGMSTEQLGIMLREGKETDGWMEKFIGTIVKLNDTGTGEFASFAEQARNATGGIQTSITNLRSRVVQGITAMLEGIEKGLAKAKLPSIAEIFDKLGLAIREAMKKAVPFIIAFVKKIAEVYQWAKKNENTVKILAKAILGLMLAFAGISVITKFVTVIASIVVAVTKVISVVRTIITIINTVMTVLKVLWAIMLANPITLIIAGIVALVAIFVTLWKKCEWFRNFWINLWNKIKSAFTSVINGIKSAFTSVVTHFQVKVNNIRAVANSIVNAFRNLPSQLLNIGRNIATGLWNGIKGMQSWVISKVKGMGKSIIKGLKNALGIHSPSKEFALIGKFSVLGYTEALDNMQKDVQRQVQDTFGLSPQLTGSMNNHYSPSVVVNNNVDVSTDPLGQTVKKIKTFSGGAKNDYNYGMGV